MKQFMVMYMAPLATIDMMMKASPAEVKTEMDAWSAWAEKSGKSLADMGAPLGRTKRLTSTGLSDVRNEITGYSIIEAELAEAAAKLFDGHPHLTKPGTSIDLLDIVDINQMMAPA